MSYRKMISIVAVVVLVIVSFGVSISDANGGLTSPNPQKEPVNVTDLLDFDSFPAMAVKDMGGKDNGVSWNDQTKTLSLNNTSISLSVKESYSSTGCCMRLPDNAKINLTGNNMIQFLFYTFPAKYLVFNERPLDLTINGTGSLTLSTNEASQGTVDMVFGNIGRLVLDGCGLFYEQKTHSSMVHFTDAETVAAINGANIIIKGSFTQGLFDEDTINLLVINSSMFLQNDIRIFDYSKESRSVMHYGSTLKVSKDTTDDPQDDFNIVDVGKYRTMKFTAEPRPEPVSPGVMAMVALTIIATAGIFSVRYK